MGKRFLNLLDELRVLQAEEDKIARDIGRLNAAIQAEADSGLKDCNRSGTQYVFLETELHRFEWNGAHWLWGGRVHLVDPGTLDFSRE